MSQGAMPPAGGASPAVAAPLTPRARARSKPGRAGADARPQAAGSGRGRGRSRRAGRGSWRVPGPVRPSRAGAGTRRGSPDRPEPRRAKPVRRRQDTGTAFRTFPGRFRGFGRRHGGGVGTAASSIGGETRQRRWRGARRSARSGSRAARVARRRPAAASPARQRVAPRRWLAAAQASVRSCPTDPDAVRQGLGPHLALDARPGVRVRATSRRSGSSWARTTDPSADRAHRRPRPPQVVDAVAGTRDWGIRSAGAAASSASVNRA